MAGKEARPVPAVGYVRQSKESESGASPEAQKDAIRAYARANGFELVGVEEDIGSSGYDPKARREGWAAVDRKVQDGEVAAVLCYRLDRISRRGTFEVAKILERLEGHGVQLVSVTENLDTKTAMGRAVLGLMAGMAQQESENTSQRVSAARRVVRRRGGWTGGPVPFGFRPERITGDGPERSRLVVDEEDGPLLREAIRRYIDGDTPGTISADWNARGLRTRRGKEWRPSPLVGIMRLPYVMGWYPDGDGGVLRGDDGQPLVLGEPLIDADTYDDLLAQLARRKCAERARPPTKRAILVGRARCANCGSRMYCKKRAGKGTLAYQCQAYAGKCPRQVSILAAELENFVIGDLMRVVSIAVDAYVEGEWETVPPGVTKYLARLAAHRRPGRSAEHREAESKRDHARDALARLRDDRDAGLFEGEDEEYRRRVARLKDAEREAVEALEKLSSGDDTIDIGPLLAVQELGAQWFEAGGSVGPYDAMADTWRDLLDLFLDELTVGPTAKPGGLSGRFDPDRVTLRWLI